MRLVMVQFEWVVEEVAVSRPFIFSVQLFVKFKLQVKKVQDFLTSHAAEIINIEHFFI